MAPAVSDVPLGIGGRHDRRRREGDPGAVCRSRLARAQRLYGALRRAGRGAGCVDGSQSRGRGMDGAPARPREDGGGGARSDARGAGVDRRQPRIGTLCGRSNRPQGAREDDVSHTVCADCQEEGRDGCNNCRPRSSLSARWRASEASNLSRITFRPYPSKYEGAWRIEVSFKRNGPCAGSEWYEPAEKLWEAWEKA